MELTDIEKHALKEVAGLYTIPEGAYNFRINGKPAGRKTTANIDITSKTDKSGIDVRIKAGTKNESVHIPVVLSVSGHKEAVYNDFYIGKDADVTIIAGCGIYNCGGIDSVHDGIHRFFVEPGAKVKYVEKHYGFGIGRGAKILNPVTEVFAKEGAEVLMELEQIKGVDSTIRKTKAELAKNAKLVVKERLMTHGKQTAETNFDISLNGEGSAADVASRSIAQDFSKQTFRMEISGNAAAKGHAECDAIIMDQAQVLAIPGLKANHPDAELIHEAAIGKIAGEQIVKLMTLGLTKEEAESKIINGFLK